MTLLKSGAENLIEMFGVTVEIYPQDSQQPDDSEDPVFFSEEENESNFNEEKVRLYTSGSEEVMQDYGIEDSADAMFYAVKDVADEGDKVVYPDAGYKWNIEEKMTNQNAKDGVYIYVYGMGAVK